MTVGFGAQRGARRIGGNDRFDWIVQVEFIAVIAAWLWISRLLLGFSCLAAGVQCLLVAALCSHCWAVLLSPHCCAWEGLITAMATHLGWQVARAALLCLCWTGWSSSGAPVQRLRPAGTGGSGAPWLPVAMAKPRAEQVHLKGSVAVAVEQQVLPWRHCDPWIRPCWKRWAPVIYKSMPQQYSAIPEVFGVHYFSTIYFTSKLMQYSNHYKKTPHV